MRFFGSLKSPPPAGGLYSQPSTLAYIVKKSYMFQTIDSLRATSLTSLSAKFASSPLTKGEFKKKRRKASALVLSISSVGSV